MSSLLLRCAPLLLSGMLAASPALAQTTGAATPAPAPLPSTPATMPAKPAAAMPKAHPVVEKRIGELRTTLKITPSQTKTFDDFAQVMRDNADRMDGLRQKHRTASPTMSAVDQMQAYGEMAKAHAEDMERLIPAFSRLYDTLSADQKKQADQSFRQFVMGQKRN